MNCAACFARIERELAKLKYESVVEKISLKISGMNCAACAARIERGLAGMDGIISVAVNFAAEKAAVKYDPSTVTIKDIRQKRYKTKSI